MTSQFAHFARPWPAVLMGLAVVAALAPRAAADDPKPAKAVMVYYSGKVQGVGFRATAAEIAKDYPVTGWVKNLSDGRVQLLAEGPDDAVEKFLAAVRKHWKDNITKEETQKQEPTGKLEGFKVVE
jgi:acylphosphatase